MTETIITESLIKERIQKALNVMILRWILTLFCLALTAYALIQAQDELGRGPKFVTHDQLKIWFLYLHAATMLIFANTCDFIFGKFQNARRLPLEKPYNDKLIALKALAIPFLPANIILWFFAEFKIIECFSLALKL